MSTTTHHITAEELFELDDGYRHELLKGELLTTSPSGAEHGAVTINLAAPLAAHVKANQLGIVFGAETGFTLERNPDTVLAPDISFVRRERIGTISKGFHQGPPDLAVEVISPKETRREVEDKTGHWLRLGVRAVWLVNPRTRTVEVRTAAGEKRILREQDALNGDNIVPSFTISVAEIFSFD